MIERGHPKHYIAKAGGLPWHSVRGSMLLKRSTLWPSVQLLRAVRRLLSPLAGVWSLTHLSSVNSPRNGSFGKTIPVLTPSFCAARCWMLAVSLRTSFHFLYRRVAG